MEEEWQDGQDLLSTESESLSDLLDYAEDSAEESDSGDIYTVVLQQDYETGHFSIYQDFINVGINGFLIGFAMASVCGLISLAFNALINIIKKGGS